MDCATPLWERGCVAKKGDMEAVGVVGVQNHKVGGGESVERREKSLDAEMQRRSEKT